MIFRVSFLWVHTLLSPGMYKDWKETPGPGLKQSRYDATLFFSTRHQAFGASFVAAQAKHFVEDLLVLV